MLPLRIERDEVRLKTDPDPVTSVLSIVRVMAQSPASTWAHAEWFGLQDAFAEALRSDKTDHPALADALNHGLAELGVDWIQVEKVERPRNEKSSEKPEVHSFHLTLVARGRMPVYMEIAP